MSIDMGKEIERKFLVKDETYKTLAEGILYHQGFLNTSKERVVRIRIVGEKGFLTIKGLSEGAKRTEFEYEIPVEDAKTMLEEICEKPIIIKYRYNIQIDDLLWEVDEFKAENEGLVVAEIELHDEFQNFDKPNWLGGEVTEDPKYYNANLIKHPFKSWK